MNIQIKLANKENLKEYTLLLQRVYAYAYTDDSLGLTKDCFSMEVFTAKNIQNILKSNLINKSTQKTWLALIDNTMVGSITIVKKGKKCVLKGFYVDINQQGKGIGRLLFSKAKIFADSKDIVLDIFAHNKRTIEIYKKWGFLIDEDKGSFYSHWPEWPEGLKVKNIYMKLYGRTNVSKSSITLRKSMLKKVNYSIKFIQDVDLAIRVMRNAGKWLQESGKNPSKYWQLKVLNKKYLLNHAESNDFYAGLIKDKPAVACLLQNNQRNQSWKSVDGNQTKSALYIHWLCVDRSFSGKNLPETMINYAKQEARKRNLPLLRLDTEADRLKLKNIYEKLGFILMGIEKDTAFYQKTV